MNSNIINEIPRPEEVVAILRQEIAGYDQKTQVAETGSVLEIGDGIATVYGLEKAVYGELVEFENGARGIVLNLERDSVGCVLLGEEAGLKEGSRSISSMLVATL